MQPRPPKARLLRRSRDRDSNGDLFEFVVWQVPKGPKNPDGIRYRFAFVPAGQRAPAVLYDNHHPKGHHKHVGGAEVAVQFDRIETTLAQFRMDVTIWKENNRGPRA